ncbi:MAG: hypothetical protein Q8916_13575 [Bacteroidota bacterium]|nr:hypothetical protein [Bacteroidota bacterium]
MKRTLVLIAILAFVISDCIAQVDFLGKTSDDVLAFASRFEYSFTDSLVNEDPEGLGIREHIRISKVTKWHTKANVSILIDTSGRVVFELFQFFSYPLDVKSGMTYQAQIEALKDMDRQFGKAELVQRSTGDVYHWETSEKKYELGGIAMGSNSDCFCNFYGETMEFCRRKLRIPPSRYFRLTDSAMIRYIDSAGHHLGDPPFAK